MMDVLEETLNEVNDNDAAWWPFLFLRPARHAPMGTARVLLLSALYGILFGLVIDIVLRLTPVSRPVHPALVPAGATFALFATYRFSFAFFWNRRARRLSHARARLAAWRGFPGGEEEG